MTQAPLVVAILAAGKGTRMKSNQPKVLHKLVGRPMVEHVIAAAETLHPQKIVVVVGPDMEPVSQAVAPHPTVVQESQLGTADAVKTALPALAAELEAGADLLVLYGDGPLITAETLQRMRAARQGDPLPCFVWLGFRPADPAGYGRMLLDLAGGLTRIVEEKDATPEERLLDLCWAGLLLGEGKAFARLLSRIGNENAKREYYLTDLAALAAGEGLRSSVVETAGEEVRGVNSRAELAVAEALLQARLRAAAMAAGATFIDPTTVYLSWDTRLGRDVVVAPQVFFGPGVIVGDDVEIRSFCHIEGARVEAGAVIGPFARLRPGAVIGAGAHVGNYVEVKNTALGPGAKANHLAYLGDAEIGSGANIGAGTITCNYDGFEKHRTTIGVGAFIGSNSSLVAPVEIGPGAVVGAGSTITESVPGDALALARGRQANIPGGGARLRQVREAAKKKDN